MITLFTRTFYTFFLVAAVAFGSTQAMAQKAKPAPAKKQAAEAKEAAPAESVTRNSARMDAADDPGAYYIVVPERISVRKQFELLRRSTPNGVSIVETGGNALYMISGEPSVLAHTRAGYPDLLWLTAEEFIQVSKLLQTRPEVMDPSYTEKLKKN